MAVKMRQPAWFTIFLSSSTLLLILYARRANAQDDCQSLETCRDCVRTANCVWCKSEVRGEEKEPPIRCVSQEYAEHHGSEWCPEREIENPESRQLIIKDSPLWANDTISVQIKPQKVKLWLRQGEKYHLKVQFRQAEDYPVDLYFLVDLSYSMQTFRNNLSKLGDRLRQTMQQLTKNFRLGFGSFVDKKLRPMVFEGIRNSHNHFAFTNHMPLTDDYETFGQIVRGAPLVETWDLPEAGLEALMQAIVCTKEIKWRSDARHLLVYVSDFAPHIAGDGRLAGVPNPNDEKCHLDSQGFYTHAEQQDYPSLGQIDWQAKEKNINIIFASVQHDKELYEAIQSRIGGSSVGVFDADSKNVIKLVSGQYKNLVKTLTMTAIAPSNLVDVQFYAKCPNKDEHFVKTNRCDGIRINQNVDFDVVIKAIDCPKREEDWHQIIEIKPEGINERVIIEVDLICDCECSQKKNKGAKSPPATQCSHNGIIECGVCSCDQGYFGKMCQCMGDGGLANSNSSLEAACRSSDSGEICSGRGRCLCGSCDCGQSSSSEYSYYGKFCQCDDFSCRRSSDGKLCGGHGNCVCGTCSCHSGWGGPACECREDTSQCMSPNGNGKVCSDAGTCECGRCMCDKKLGREGRYCEDCPSCPSQRCDEFKDCVECLAHKSGKIYQEDKECNQCLLDLDYADDIKEDPEKFKTTGQHFCRIAGDDGSTFIFTYMYKDGSEEPTIVAKREKDHRVITDFIAATFGVIFLTLLLGFLILLIWKIYTHLHDKREFEKFDKDREQSKWGQGQNPLYSNPVTTFQNPTFEEVLQQEEY